jgi:tRNA pseudouridine13 synthase
MQRPLSLGELDGNRFHITVRDLAYADDNTKELMAHIESISSGVASGIPNYFGIQRFGVKRPITHKVGFEILKQNYEEAIAVFVGCASSYEPPETQAARHDYYTSRDPKAALRDLPMQLSLERSILYHLEKHPTEYLEALCVLPKTLRSMFVGAVQSWFFNLTLSTRLSDGQGLLPGVGDRVLLTDGRFDVVSKRTQPMVMTQIKRGRIEPALFMPGSLEYSIEGRDDEVMADLMRAHDLDSRAFKEASQAIGMQFDGAVRSTLLNADVTATLSVNTNSHPNTQAVTFSFALGPGKYATTVLREYMKTDPLHMV